MNRIFVDTAGWAILFIPKESRHEAAVSTIKKLVRDKGVAVTTNYVVSEFVALMTSPYRLSKPRQIEFLDAIVSSPWVQCIHVDASLHSRSLDLWRSRIDKNWSLVDCASFTVMTEGHVGLALTTDHHFEQAGFHCIPE